MKIRKICLIVLLILPVACQEADNEKNHLNQINILTSKFEQLLQNSIAAANYEGMQIPNISLLDGGLLSKKIDQPTLIFRFSESNCQECVEQTALSIKTLFANNETHVIILADFAQNRKLQIYLNKLGLSKFKYYQIEQGRQDWAIDNISAPFLFITDNSLKMDNILLPHYSFPELTEGYLTIIADRLLKRGY